MSTCANSYLGSHWFIKIQHDKEEIHWYSHTSDWNNKDEIYDRQKWRRSRCRWENGALEEYLAFGESWDWRAGSSNCWVKDAAICILKTLAELKMKNKFQEVINISWHTRDGDGEFKKERNEKNNILKKNNDLVEWSHCDTGSDFWSQF